MGRLSRISERDAERLLKGKPPEDDAELTELASLLADVGRAYSRPPAESAASRHLAAIADAVKAPAKPALRTTWRQKFVFIRALSRTWRIVLASATAILAMSGLAVAGALPDPVQGTVSRAADTIGISVEDPDDADDGGLDDDADDAEVDDLEDGDVDDGEAEDEDADEDSDEDADEDADERSTKRSVARPERGATEGRDDADGDGDEVGETEDDADDAPAAEDDGEDAEPDEATPPPAEPDSADDDSESDEPEESGESDEPGESD